MYADRNTLQCNIKFENTIFPEISRIKTIKGIGPYSEGDLRKSKLVQFTFSSSETKAENGKRS